jgi:KDO2-lipid IV(A) lauroyltransferase
LFSKRRKLAEKNMALAMPELSSGQVKTEIGEMYNHLGILAMDVLNLGHFHDEPDLSRYFDFENLENLKEAYKKGKGVLILTGHLGNWEAGSCFLPRLGFPTVFIAKRMKNPQMDSFIRATREQGGAEMIDAKRGARKILKALGEGKVVCVLMDQHNREGILVDFFGRPAQTTSMMVQLAMKTGAPVVPAFTFRTEDNRYSTVFGEVTTFASSADPDDIKEHTQRCNDMIEMAVRSKPSQWFWLHNRWKRPDTSCHLGSVCPHTNKVSPTRSESTTPDTSQEN